MSKTNTRLLLGAAILAVIFVLGVVMPLFAPEDPRIWNTQPRNLKPSVDHLLGTTNLGQDTFWLLAWSTRNSLIIGFLVAIAATVIGVLAGMTAGFVGGVVDRVLTLLMDVFIVVPSLPILILLASMLQGKASIYLISGILIIFNWPWPARQSRSMALSMREREFVNTAWFSGEQGWKIIIREIFPFITAWAFANLINTVLVAIGAESSLAVIGLSSLQESTLGTMIYWALQHQALLGRRWWWIGAPVVTIVVMFIGLFLFSTGLSERSAERRGR
ncbi:MAG: ABC transporter permease [Chloroflexota bacterium]|jgi:peptide/nickel transport system permease protein|nr:ABC transporter permease [Chloroflexota bacterium]